MGKKKIEEHDCMPVMWGEWMSREAPESGSHNPWGADKFLQVFH